MSTKENNPWESLFKLVKIIRIELEARERNPSNESYNKK